MKTLTVKVALFQKGDRVQIWTDMYRGPAEVMVDQKIYDFPTPTGGTHSLVRLTDRFGLVTVKPDAPDMRVREVSPDRVTLLTEHK